MNVGTQAAYRALHVQGGAALAKVSRGVGGGGVRLLGLLRCGLGLRPTPGAGGGALHQPGTRPSVGGRRVEPPNKRDLLPRWRPLPHPSCYLHPPSPRACQQQQRKQNCGAAALLTSGVKTFNCAISNIVIPASEGWATSPPPP